MTTYFADDMSVLDTFTIYKTLNTADMESLISQAQGLNQADYTEESWNKLQAALKAATELKNNANATQSDIDAATTALQEAIDGLVKVDNQDGEVVNTGDTSDEQINGPQTGDTANAVEIVSAVSAFIAAGTIVVVLTKKKMKS